MKPTTMQKIKKTFVALAVCVAGDAPISPAGAIGVGGSTLAAGKGVQAYLNQVDASSSSNSNGVNALNQNIQGGISGSQSTQVKSSSQSPGM